jgi:Zn-dependent protease
MDFTYSIITIGIWWTILVFSVVVHECAHGIAAYKLGDPTAYLAGRITLNPIKHIDLMWTIVIPIVLLLSSTLLPPHRPFTLGGAKPVPVNIYKLKNIDKGWLIVSLVGPLSNFALALLGLIGYVVVVKFIPLQGLFLEIYVFIFSTIIMLNVVLGVFNLIPIPPLDGSGILRYFLPWHMKEAFDRIGMFGIMILLFLIASGGTNFIGSILYEIDKFLKYIAK